MKFTDYKSTEKSIINYTFKSIPYMDMWISSIVEGYIYEKVDKLDNFGFREEYLLRYNKKEGEYKAWWDNGNRWIEEYYIDGKEEGECKEWNYEGRLTVSNLYKDGEVIEVFTNLRG